MAYRLLVVDLDGTARSRVLGIAPGVRAAVAAAQARGVRVSVATGRMWRSAMPHVELLGAEPPIILYNGGQVFDFGTGRILYDRRLPEEAARAALEVIRRDPSVQPHLFLRDRVYVERAHPLTEAYAADDGLSYEVVPSFETLSGEEPHKILVVGVPERIRLLERTVRQSGVPIHAVRSERTQLEILPRGVSKGTALRAMMGLVEVRAEEVLAVGDGWNDLEMLEVAGLGVAMGHAPAGLRARADFVCGTSEEEGLREVIERFVLERTERKP